MLHYFNICSILRVMDFLDPKKKRAHRIRLFIGYGLMAVALAMATLILVFASYGYDIDRANGGIIQNGLVIVDAHPEAANIEVNGMNKGTTTNRLILPAGQYTVNLTRSGYRSWNHAVSLEGSSIEQLVYPFLFPQQLVTKTLQTYNAIPTLASESPDRHWLVVNLPETPGAFQVVDLNNKQNPATTVSLPTDAFTTAAGAHTFEAVEWSTDNVHLLLKHSFTGGSEFIIFDRDTPANSVNLNKVFPNQPFTIVNLRDKKADQFYLYNAPDGNLFTADTKNKSPTLVQSHVQQFKSYQADTLLYVLTPPAGTTTSEVHYVQSGNDYILRTLPVASKYLMDMAKFNNHFYVVVGSPTDGHNYVYQDPLSAYTHKPAQAPRPFRVLIEPQAQYLSFSAIARFIAVQSGSSFAVYDAETGRQFHYDTKLNLTPDQKATWMDGHRLMFTSGDTIVIFDFDGTNLQKLSPSNASFTPFFDRDYTALFSLAPQTNAADKLQLLRTELKVLPPSSSQ